MFIAFDVSGALDLQQHGSPFHAQSTNSC